MEWIFVTISSLFNQFTVLIFGLGFLTVLMHLVLARRRSRKFHSDYHRLLEQRVNGFTDRIVANSKAVAEDPDSVLKRLQAIRAEIAGLEKEYNSLKKKL